MSATEKHERSASPPTARPARVCGIDFGAVYGDFANGYIHVHHKTPVHQAAADGEYELDP